MRESTKTALNKFYERQAREADPLRKRRKNGKPELEFAKKVDDWFKVNGWVMSKVESKGVYNFEAGRYDHGQTEQGFSDRVGVTPYHGVAAFVELKARGKRSTLKPHQRDFLVERIIVGAFAVCIDSIESLQKIFLYWRHLRMAGQTSDAVRYLIEQLPLTRVKTDRLESMFDETE